MTWTATERELRTSIDGHDEELLVTLIRDQDTHLVCQLSADSDDPAAIEQMRARVRLIVQAEAMLDALADYGTLEAIADEIDCFEHSARSAALRGIAQEYRAIIAATGGNDG